MKINLQYSMLLALCMGLLFSCNQNSKIQMHSDTALLRNLVMVQQEAWNRGDIEGFMKGYHKDSLMQFITKKGTRKGWLETLNSYKKHYPGKDSMGRLAFTLHTIEFMDDDKTIGHIAGIWKLYRAKDTLNGYFSLITREFSDGPKIVIDHTW
jgi:hypothetical protein